MFKRVGIPTPSPRIPAVMSLVYWDLGSLSPVLQAFYQGNGWRDEDSRFSRGLAHSGEKSLGKAPGDAGSPGTSGDERRLVHVGCPAAPLAPRASGADPGLDPSERNSS